MNILIVDDNDDSRKILRKSLEHKGYTIEEAFNGIEALRLARKSSPDMIISDILMPEMDGFRLCRETKADKHLNKIPFIIYTATYIDPKDEDLAMSLGASRFIIKPAETDDFMKTIHEVFHEYEENRLNVPRMPLKDDTELSRMYEKSVVKMLDEKIQELETEIKRRKEAEIVIKDSEEKYRTLFEAAGDAIFTVKMEEDGPRFVDFNRRVLDLFQCTREEMMTKTPADISPLKQPDGRLSRERILEVAAAALEGRPQFFEWIQNRMDGTPFPAEVSLSPVDIGNERYIQVIVRDITNRRKVEESLIKANEEIEAWNTELEKRVKEQTEELVRSQAKLIQSEKLSAMGHMAGGLAHELNSPMAGLLPMLEKDMKREEKDSEAYWEKSLMLKACKHMARIVRDFGSFSRESKGEFCELDLNEIIDDTLSFSAVKLRHKGINIIKEYGDNLQKVQGEKTELQQVVLNIITNACDAIPEGGKFTIKTGIAEDKNSLTMEFIDNGIGIEKEELDKIFDPFFTTKEPGKGTGLGLSVSYGIIKKHGGEILVKSEPGKGTGFTVLLPVAKLTERHYK